MVADDYEGEISVRGNHAVTAQFFYVMRAVTVATASQERFEQAPTPERRLEAARAARAALTALRENLLRVADLLDDPTLPEDTHAMFAQTLASQETTLESLGARYAAALAAAGLRDASLDDG